jgi:hypothetical protein
MLRVRTTSQGHSARLSQRVFVLDGHEPVFVDAERAVGIVGAHVGAVVDHNRGAVAVQKVVIAHRAPNNG